jgi:hypothetical protein
MKKFESRQPGTVLVRCKAARKWIFNGLLWEISAIIKSREMGFGSKWAPKGALLEPHSFGKRSSTGRNECKEQS